MKSALIASLAMGCICAFGFSESLAADLPDRQAKEIIEKIFNSTKMFVQTGEVTIHATENNLDKRLVSDAVFKGTYRELERAGYLTIQSAGRLEQQFQGNQGSWDQFLNLSRGVREKITVRLSNQGMKISEPVAGKSELVSFSTGKYTIVAVIKNEEVVKGFDTYRLVMGTHTARYSDVFMATVENKALAVENRKFACLLKFDPFKSNWFVRGYTTGNIDGALDTQGLSELIGR